MSKSVFHLPFMWIGDHGHLSGPPYSCSGHLGSWTLKKTLFCVTCTVCSDSCLCTCIYKQLSMLECTNNVYQIYTIHGLHLTS